MASPSSRSPLSSQHPILTSSPAPATPATPTTPHTPTSRPRAQSTTSTLDSFWNARPPPGFCAAAGEAFGRAPTLAELRRNSASSGERRRSSVATPGTPSALAPEVIKERMSEDLPRPGERPVREVNMVAADEEQRRSRLGSLVEDEEDIKEKREREEGKPGWWAVTKHGLAAFWKWFLTPLVCFSTF